MQFMRSVLCYIALDAGSGSDSQGTSGSQMVFYSENKTMDYLPEVSGYLVEKIKFALYGFPTHQPPTAESKSLLEKLIFF